MHLPSSHKSPRERGNTLLMTLCISLIIGFALICYLQLTNTQVHVTTRSEVWNSCIPVVEAGIEDALTHCIKNYRTNMVSNGWAQTTNGYGKSATLGAEDYYDVNISASTPYEIISQGYCRMPGSSQFISRAVKVVTKPVDWFPSALVVVNTIDMNGNNVGTDSYDSMDPTKSTNGKYDPLKAGDKGDVTCGSSLYDSASIGNANVWGHVYTGSGGNVSTGPNGAVGSIAWQTGGNSGIEPGWAGSLPPLSFPAVEPPFISATPAIAGTVDGTGYDYVLGTGNYMLSGISGKAYVTGNAILYVTGSITFGPTDSIELAPKASLRLYVAGASATINTVVNPNADASSFAYFGLPSNTSIKISGNSQFTGTVYAPNADLKINGDVDFYGSITAHSAVLTGHSQFHYDESLGRIPPLALRIVSWTEL